MDCVLGMEKNAIAFVCFERDEYGRFMGFHSYSSQGEYPEPDEKHYIYRIEYGNLNKYGKLAVYPDSVERKNETKEYWFLLGENLENAANTAKFNEDEETKKRKEKLLASAKVVAEERRTQGEMHYIHGIRTFTVFRNIGDRARYENWVEHRAAGQKSRELSGMDPGTSTGLSEKECEPYIQLDRIGFYDLDFEKLRIPEYQRGYVWDKNNWEALLNRLCSETKVSLGTMIIYSKDDIFSIVDGQQRLTTLFVLDKVIRGKEWKDIEPILSKMHGGSVSEKDLNNCEKAFRFFAEKLKDDSIKPTIHMENVRFHKLNICGQAPSVFQYQVFTSINGKGKRLTTDEKNW